jgi:hypothetical protein
MRARKVGVQVTPTEFRFLLLPACYRGDTPNGGAPVKIGNMLAVKVRYRQGVASQSGSESWGGGSNTAVQALTGERIGWVLSCEKE